jgi:nucleoside-diphosphate-sugar epimerase
MSPQTRACAVTGASGYLGSRLCRSLTEQGWTVYRLGRGAATDPLAVPWSLDADAPARFLADTRIDALVHCAWDLRAVRWSDIERINVQGSIRMLDAAHRAGVRDLVFISTISAFTGCRSDYGRAKLLVERETLRLGGSVIRPGLVYGPTPGGMLGALTKAVTALPVVPLIGSGRHLQYLAHEDDLAALVASLLEPAHPPVDAPVLAANEHPLTFREILARLAAAHGRRPRLVPLPWRLFWAGLKTAETVGLRPGFRSDSVVSLVNQDPQPDFAMTRKLGARFRAFGES